MTYSKDKVRTKLQRLRDQLDIERMDGSPAQVRATTRLLDEALALLDAPEGEGREGPQWISVQAYDGLKAHAEAMATADYDPGCDCPKCAATTAYRVDFPAPQASRSTDTNDHEHH